MMPTSAEDDPQPQSEFDLYDLADRHGLRPIRFGQTNIRFVCPVCDSEHNRRRGRTASGAPSKPHQPWHCWRASCGASGTSRDLAAYLGEAIERRRKGPDAPPPPRPKPQRPANDRNKIDMGLAWEQLTNSIDGASQMQVYEWACRRGWPEVVAQAVSLSDSLLAIPRQIEGFEGRRLAAQARKVERTLVVPIRDAGGVVRSAARRDLADSAAPKSLTVSTRMTGPGDTWGGIWAYGSLPAAIEAAAAGDPIYLVEGAPDYIALEGLLMSHGEPGAVIGYYSTSTAPTLVRALVNALGARGLLAPRIVLVPDNDAKPGQQIGPGLAAANEAADLLRGRAGVYMARLPDGAVDLSERLAQDTDIDPVLRMLRGARCVYPAPVSLQQASGEMDARIRRVVVEATNRKSQGRHSLIVFRVPPGVGKTYSALQAAAEIVSGDFDVPINGQRPKGVPKEAWPPPRRSVVFACEHHRLTDEKINELQQLAPGTPVAHVYGMLHYCRFAETVEDVYPSIGRRGICGSPGDEDQRCPHADECFGADEPVAHRGQVTFVPHAMVGKLKADLVVIDESPGVVDLQVAPASKVATMFACKLIPRVLAWRRKQNPDAADAARRLNDLIAPRASKHASDVSAGQVDPYAARMFSEDLWKMLDGAPGLVDELEAGFNADAVPPPVPSPAEIRHGVHAANHMPNRPAFGVLRQLALAYRHAHPAAAPAQAALDEAAASAGGPDACADDDRPQRRPDPLVCVRLDMDGSWALEVRKVRQLPKSPIIVLDATGDLTLPEWQAAYPDRRVVMRTLDVQGTAPASAIHMTSRGFSRSTILFRDEGYVRQDATGRICKAIDELLGQVQTIRVTVRAGDVQIRIGILTHKPIADAMLGLGHRGEYFGGPELRQYILDLQARGIHVKIGWFGHHDRATNAFSAVDGLAVIGDPVANLGDLGADARLLGLNGDDIAQARAAAICIQAIARARHICRGPQNRVAILFAGRMPPSIPGVMWTENQVARGARPAPEVTAYIDAGWHVAGMNGCVSVEAIDLFVELGGADGPLIPLEELAKIRRPNRHRIVVAIARKLGWRTFHINTPKGRLTVAAGDRATAESWACLHKQRCKML